LSWALVTIRIASNCYSNPASLYKTHTYHPGVWRWNADQFAQ